VIFCYAQYMIEFFPSRTIALSIAGFSIHWYGLLYLAGFLLAFLMLPRIQKWRNLQLTSDDWSSILAWGIVGVIVGGRLGFVLFYEPWYFLSEPLEIVQVWHGGMSSHGGMIGLVLGILFAARKRGIDSVALMDCIVIPGAIGLALGRIGNFINQELYGSVTTLPWGIAVPDVEGLRHPTQWYAVLKDLFIAVACYWHLRTYRNIPGRTLALFLMLYGALRYLLEYLRVQTYPLTDLKIILLSRGQLLTLPLFLAGALFWWWLGRQASPER